MPSFDTPGPISVSIELPIGEVRISSGDRADTVVDVQPSRADNDDDRRAAEQTRVDYADEHLTVKGARARAWLTRARGGSVDVTIELPAGSHAEGAVGIGAFVCDGRLGDCRLRTGVGDIRVDHAGAVNAKTGTGDVHVDVATGHAEVAAGSGEVRLRELDHTGVVKNANGDIWVGSAAGALRVRVANGSISVDRAQTSVGAKTATGDVRVGEVVRGSVVLETHAGDVDLGIREGTAAWLDVRSIAGSVHNALDAAEAPEPSAATVEVRARTTVGDVAIRRA
jgi:Putative adhesin